MKKINTAQTAIGIVCLILAFSVTMQIKSVSHNRRVGADLNLRDRELLVQLRDEREINETLYAQILQYKEELQSFKEESLKSSDYSQTLARQLERAEILAGLTTVEGPGVIITMRDSRSKEQLTENPNDSVIHDEDLLRVINELLDGGAEAVSLNDERIVATSEVRCAGATVSINNRRYAEPYEIKAIGDPANLESALMMRRGVYEILTYYGIEVSIKRADVVKVLAFNGIHEFKYAKSAAPDPIN